MKKLKIGRALLSLIILYIAWVITGTLLESVLKNAIIERKTMLLGVIDELRRKVYNL